MEHKRKGKRENKAKRRGELKLIVVWNPVEKADPTDHDGDD